MLTITSMLLVTAALLMLLSGCNGESGIVGNNSRKDAWLEYLKVIPKDQITMKGSYIQDREYMHELEDRYPEVTERYAVGSLRVTGSSGLFLYYYNMTDPEADVPEEYRQTIGFTLEEVGQIIKSGIQPSIYQAYRGEFDKEVIDNAVKTGPRNDELEIIQYGDTEFYKWGEDHQANLSLRSNVRPLGMGYRLVVMGDFVFWVGWTEGIKHMIDSYSGNINSLADIEEYQLIAEGLSRLDVFSAYLTGNTNSYDELKSYLEKSHEIMPFRPGQEERMTAAIEDVPLLKPYLAYATGAGLDENGFYLAVVLVNSDSSIAKSNTDLMKQRIEKTENVWQGRRWTEWFTEVQIENDGILVMAKLYGSFCEFWHDRFNNLDVTAGGAFEPLLLHE